MKKRIVSVLAAMVIVFAVGVIPAFADGGAGGGTIEIHKTANLSFAGSTFSAYKIFDLTTSVSGEDTAYAYTLNPAFNGFPIPSGFADLKAYLEDQTSDSVAMNAVAKDLYNYITGHGVPAAASYTVNGSADANIIMISADGSGTGTIIDQYITLGGPQYNKTVPSPGHIEWVPIPGAYLGGPLGFGYYLVYSTGVASGNITVVAACTLTTVSPKAEVHPKMDGPKLTKTVYNEEADAWGNTADANIGDVLHFSLDSAVPVTTGYDEYVYTIHDDLSAGLTLDESSINVTVGGRDVTGDYTLNTATQGTAPADGCTFEIVFDSDQFLSYPIGDAIKVTYSATLNENAAVADLNDIMYALANGYARNPNDAWLDYSTNPYDTSKKASTPPNHVDVYTYMVNVKKVIEGTNAPLSGATFALFKSEADARAA
ncbi:MAG: isopeptide-forming domain-containing fimbrial protein, partial [Defluviitaleaceae bacterium]|nr:isopeptide-forming domain-containing fimbrial protein [Defluviitaleaceae bacterium]